jgi:hypothetical protein
MAISCRFRATRAPSATASAATRSDAPGARSCWGWRDLRVARARRVRFLLLAPLREHGLLYPAAQA